MARYTTRPDPVGVSRYGRYRMTMRLRSGIGRGFDLSYPSNRFVLLATPLLGVVAGVATLVVGEGWGEAVRNGVSAGGSAFLAWTIARELHPDHASLAVPATLAAPLGVLLADPDLLAAATVMLVARVTAGTTGRALTPIDLLVLFAVAGPVAVRSSGVAVLAGGAVALLVGTVVVDRGRFVLGVAAAALATGAVVSALTVEAASGSSPWWALLALPAAVSLAGPGRVEVGTDRSGGTISPWRVRLARGYAVAAAGGAALTTPAAALAPVWVALFAVAGRPR